MTQTARQGQPGIMARPAPGHSSQDLTGPRRSANRLPVTHDLHNHIQSQRQPHQGAPRLTTTRPHSPLDGPRIEPTISKPQGIPTTPSSFPHFSTPLLLAYSSCSTSSTCLHNVNEASSLSPLRKSTHTTPLPPPTTPPLGDRGRYPAPPRLSEPRAPKPSISHNDITADRNSCCATKRRRSLLRRTRDTDRRQVTYNARWSTHCLSKRFATTPATSDPLTRLSTARPLNTPTTPFSIISLVSSFLC